MFDANKVDISDALRDVIQLLAGYDDKIRIVLDGLRGDDSIAELCRREGIAQRLYYT